MNNNIRRAKIEDLTRIAEIEIFNYRLNFYPIFQNDWYYFDELQVPAQVKKYVVSVEQMWVYDDGVVKGFMQVENREVRKLFVEPVLQGHSIGGELLDYAIAEMDVHFLWALEKNVRAMAFYERHGFRVTNDKKLEDGTTEYLVRLERKEAEIWDLYSEDRKLLGKDHIRGEQLPIGCYHLVVHVWIRNSKGEYLISQRSATRPTFPLMWECVGGSVVKGEDSLQGAIREAKEEVGVDLLPENGRVLFTKTRKTEGGRRFQDIMDVWLFEYDGEVDLRNATTDEVAQVVWMNRGQIMELFRENAFVETLNYFFTEVEKPFDMRQC